MPIRDGILEELPDVNDGILEQVPVGWRFAPTDEELILSYLTKKVFVGSLPAWVIEEIDADEFYSKHPKDLVENVSGEREWYFFINRDEYFHGKMEKNRWVGNRIGYWKSIAKENPIRDAKGNVFAFKIRYTYFSANPKHKRTHWRMEEFRLLKRSKENIEEDFHIEEWVVARITRGEDYSSSSRFY
ncbi:NAC domain-containing protein JA2 [Sesamum alatum]|uniref:NAC domain-containing protein JA2 n=1 Tax=Sesamum alatum TaxID=300844 RepID=A0AAE1YV03_9LAMI|nr:NAC domain-containing protein JA2 [Sesamum alatum]